MTFIGIATKGDHAEIVTDTVSYSPRGARFRPSSKQNRFEHLDAVLVTSGNGQVAWHANTHAGYAATNADTFDDLIEGLPHWYGYALNDAGFDPTARYGMQGSVCLVGYSDRLGEFAAYIATTATPKPKRIEGVHLQPPPLSLRPSNTQLTAFLRGLRTMGAPEEKIQQVHTIWTARPKATTPTNDDDWVRLASLARDERSMTELMRVWIAGKLIRTTLWRGASESRTIHEFDDVGELERLVAGSLHPVAQMAICAECDSGVPALDCCIPRHTVGTRCDCGSPSGANFEDCCMVTDRNAVERALWTGPTPYGRNSE